MMLSFMKIHKTSYKAKNIVLATGSQPTSLPGVEIDEKNVLYPQAH